MARVVLRDELRNMRITEVTEWKQLPDQRGHFFLLLVEHWGMVSGQRGRDTSTGHPTMELLPVEAVIARATDMTRLAFRTLEDEGWAIDITRPAEDPDDGD